MNLFDFFSQSHFMPHIHCYLGNQALISTMFTTDLLIGIAYVVISVTLWGLVRKIKIPFSLIILCFGAFIGACGATHFMEVYTLWNPNYWASAMIKILTAIASVGTAIYLYGLRGPLFQVAEAAKLSEQRRLDLEVLTDTLENKVEERTQSLHRALKTRDDFLSVASHELRTPITALRLKTELKKRMLAKDPDGTSQKEIKYNQEIEEQLLRLSNLVESLLDISRAKSGHLPMIPEKLNLSELIEHVLNNFLPTLHNAKIELLKQIEGPIESWGDPTRLEQAVNNILSNAARYAPGVPLSVTVKKVGDTVEMVFHDQGAGIAQEESQHVFDRFKRLNPKEHKEGMGVGLYLSRAIIRAHRGEIETTPTKKGARFVIKMPLVQDGNSLDPFISVSDNN